MNFLRRNKKSFSILIILVMLMQMLGPVGGLMASAEELDATEETQEELVEEGQDDLLEEPNIQDNKEEIEAEKAIDEESTEKEDLHEAEEKEIAKISGGSEGIKETNVKNQKTSIKSKEKSKSEKKGFLSPEKNTAFVNEDDEKHGFGLKLSEVTDLDGNSYDDDKLLELEDEFKLKIAWNLEDGHNYKDGNIETFDLPNGIKIAEEFEIELKSGVLDVATAFVKTDGTIELEFTDFVETHSKVSGYIEIISKIDEESAEVDDGNIILEPIGDEGKIKIPIDLGEREKTIEKKGTPNKGYNADEIAWEVTINKMKNNLTGAKVTDELPLGTEFKKGSLIVTKLDVDLKGNIKGDLEEVSLTDTSVDDGTLNISLGNIQDAYRIEYVTTVTDDELETFENNAKLSDNDLEAVSAKATVTINRGEPIKKSVANSYNPKNGIIEWVIEFNYNQKHSENITLKDAWTPKGKMHQVKDSLKFQEVTIDKDGNAHNKGEAIDTPEGAELVNGDDQFEVTDIKTDKAYKITYQTKVNDRVLDSFDISNVAGFGNESNGSGTKVDTYYGSKSAVNVNYAAKTIDWTIKLNHDEYPMEKISILDTLGDGLTLDKGSIKITVDGNKYEEDYTVSYDNLADNQFNLKFPEDFITDKKIVIKYKTDFVADNVTDNLAKNKADITWTPEGGSDSITKIVEAETPLNEETKNNHWKNGSYNPDTKEITWTIFANYRENILEDLIVTDKPQGNQEIVEDSAVVKELEIASDGTISEVDNVDVNSIIVLENTLEVSIGKTNKAYKIEYRTSLEGLSDIQKEYVNQAEVFDGNESLSEIEAKVAIAKAHTYGAKSGEQDGKQVHWAVTVNPGQQKVENLKLEDTVSENQDILSDTFKVYEAKVDTYGKATKKGDSISSDKYELTYEEGKPTFTVEWKETVEIAFIVEYSTLFFAGHNEDVTNSYIVTGDNIVEDGKTDGSGSVKIKQFGSGGGVGTAGYLIIDKIDSTYNQEESKLEGIKFDLIDPDTDKVLKSGITDEDGQIDFGRLLFGDYKLEEINVPDGYVTPEETQTITIDKAYDSNKDKKDYIYLVENYVPVFAIELSKTGKNETPLEGAEFMLFDSNDKELQTTTTDENGKIIFEDLEGSGDYYIQETKAPVGYLLDETKHKVTIGEKESKPVEVSAKNEVLTGKTKVQGEKIWKDNSDKNGERPDKITVNLLQNNESFKSVTVKANKAKKIWEYSFEDLEQYDENGIPYTYTVDEEDVVGYEKSINKHNITNRRVGVTDITATKEWLNGPEIKPNIELQLYRNDEVFGDPVELVNGTLAHTWTNLELTDMDGKEYKYTVDELETPINYVKELSEDELTVTNKYVIPKIDVTATKTWKNGPEVKPTIKLQLFQDGEVYGDPIKLADGTLEYTWKDLEKTDIDGKVYEYTVKEVETPENYESQYSENGLTVTNTYVSPKTEITGTKIWENGPKVKPTIELQLYRTIDSQEKVGEPVKLVNGETEYTWTDLDLTNKDGEKYTYSVKEVATPENYEMKLSEDELTVINTYVSPKTKVTANKIWIGGPEIKPTIQFQLYRNDVAVEDEIIELEPGTLEYTWKDLDETDNNGNFYEYTVKEVNVPDDYEMSVSEDGLTITNTHESVSGSHKPETPPTGIDNNTMFFRSTFLLGVAGLITLGYKRKDKYNK